MVRIGKHLRSIGLVGGLGASALYHVTCKYIFFLDAPPIITSFSSLSSLTTPTRSSFSFSFSLSVIFLCDHIPHTSQYLVACSQFPPQLSSHNYASATALCDARHAGIVLVKHGRRHHPVPRLAQPGPSTLRLPQPPAFGCRKTPSAVSLPVSPTRSSTERSPPRCVLRSSSTVGEGGASRGR